MHLTKKAPLLFISLLSLSLSCKKDTARPDEEPQEPVVIQDPSMTFVFVNRIGFRNDSTRHGLNDTVFQGPCIENKFYDRSEDKTFLGSVCYNRNFQTNNYPLTDSIVYKYQIKTIEVRDKYGYQIELIWKRPVWPYTTKVLRFNTKNYDAGDTIKVAKDTTIKFIWPDDTNSGKFVKTYQWP